MERDFGSLVPVVADGGPIAARAGAAARFRSGFRQIRYERFEPRQGSKPGSFAPGYLDADLDPAAELLEHAREVLALAQVAGASRVESRARLRDDRLAITGQLLRAVLPLGEQPFGFRSRLGLRVLQGVARRFPFVLGGGD